MSDLETLQSMLTEAGLGKEGDRFQKGILRFSEPKDFKAAEDVLAWITDHVSENCQGWLCLAEKVIKISGEPPEWEEDAYPLSGEWSDGSTTWQIRRAARGWIACSITINSNAGGLIEERRMIGRQKPLTYQLGWAGHDVLRLQGQRYQETSTND